MEVAIIAIASSTRRSRFHCITEGIRLIIGQSRKREEEVGCPRSCQKLVRKKFIDYKQSSNDGIAH